MPQNRPAIPAAIERQVLIEAGHRCAVCGSEVPLERAHIIAWSRSKDHSAENLLCLCANCHGRADVENWGEATLRQYKKRPWVLRARTEEGEIREEGQANLRSSTEDKKGIKTFASFDVFLSHNRKDKLAVRELAQALDARGVKVWLDEWELIPGRPWQEALEEIIQTTRSAAVLVGKDGFGPWEEVEMRACLTEFVDRKLPVIPVLLSGAPDRPRLPLFLKGLTWVDLREPANDGMDRLEWGITGKDPRRSKPLPAPSASTVIDDGSLDPNAPSSASMGISHGTELGALEELGGDVEIATDTSETNRIDPVEGEAVSRLVREERGVASAKITRRSPHLAKLYAYGGIPLLLVAGLLYWYANRDAPDEFTEITQKDLPTAYSFTKDMALAEEPLLRVLSKVALERTPGQKEIDIGVVIDLSSLQKNAGVLMDSVTLPEDNCAKFGTDNPVVRVGQKEIKITSEVAKLTLAGGIESWACVDVPFSSSPMKVINSRRDFEIILPFRLAAAPGDKVILIMEGPEIAPDGFAGPAGDNIISMITTAVRANLDRLISPRLCKDALPETLAKLGPKLSHVRLLSDSGSLAAFCELHVDGDDASMVRLVQSVRNEEVRNNSRED